MSSVAFISPPFTDSQCPASNFSFSNASAPLFAVTEWIGAGIVPSANTNTVRNLTIPLINVSPFKNVPTQENNHSNFKASAPRSQAASFIYPSQLTPQANILPQSPRPPPGPPR